MSAVLMDVFAELVTWTLSIYPVEIDSFEPATVMQSAVTYGHHFLCYMSMCINGLRLSEIPLFKRSQFHSFVACLNAVAMLITNFGNLLMVDKRYSSLAIILIILLIFVVALFVIVSRKGRTEKKEVSGEEEESKHDGFSDISVEGSSRTEDHTGKKKLKEQEASSSHDKFSQSNITGVDEIKGDRTGKKEVRGGEEKRWDLLGMVRLPSMLLCFMRYFRNSMEMTNCLLFLSCCLGELTLMIARLPSELDVAPAVEVVHRAFLVMELLTAHTMAAELLGEGVVLVCMPELLAALAWLIIYLGSCDNEAAACAVRTVMAAVRKAELPLLCLVGILASIIVTDTDEAEDLLWANMSSAIVAVLASVVLPSLCMLVLRQWQGQTTAAPSPSGLEDLLSLCRYVPCKALIIFFLAKQMLLADTLVVPLMFSVFCLALLLAAGMYARDHGLRGLRVRAAGRGEKRD